MASVKKKSAAKTKKPAKSAAKRTAPKKITKAPARKKAASKTRKVSAPKGLPEQMLDAALKVLDERKAEDILTVSLAERSAMADYMIVASGRAGRQIVAIADHLREAFYKLGVHQTRVEGQADANWVLVDAGDVIIHLFRPEVRAYYDLDSLWGKKPSKK